MKTVTRLMARTVSVVLAGLVAVTLVLAFLATAEAASRGGGGHRGGGGGHRGGVHHGGRHGHHHGHHHRHRHHWHGWRGCCWGGFYASPFFYPYYPYYYGYAYPPPVYTYTSPPVYVQSTTSTPRAEGYTSLDTTPIQREVVYPHGKYVLYGDGVTQAWQWIWVPNPPAAAPQN